MSLIVTLTGTGTPNPNPDRAGGGVLVQVKGFNLQFDAGRATSMRLAALGVHPGDVDAVFLTHHHSDHLQGLDDLVFTRRQPGEPTYKADPYLVVAPDGPLRYFLEHVMDKWKYDLEVRNVNRGQVLNPSVEPVLFEPTNKPNVVWERNDVRVSAVTVRHEPVVPAVGYRVDSPSGSVAISGDTTVCDEIEDMSAGVDILVHEAMLSEAMVNTPAKGIMHYHSDAQAIGEMAERAGARRLLLTHLIPPPERMGTKAEGVARYEKAVKDGGFTGEIYVGDDLTSITIP